MLGTTPVRGHELPLRTRRAQGRSRGLLALLLLVAPASAAAEELTATSSVASESDRPLLTHQISLEYRITNQYLRPLSLNDLTARKVSYWDQRLRVGADSRLGDVVRIVGLFDVLDGVLFGDNGSFSGDPRRNSGLLLAAKSPNLATLDIGILDPNGSSIDRDNYGIILAGADPVRVEHLYGEVLLPFGLLRAGRQPIAQGRSVLVHDGSRINRWGISRASDSVDGLTFGTKLSAIGDVLAHRPIDASRDRGLFGILHFAQVVENLPQNFDDLYQFGAITQFKAKNEKIFGVYADRLDTGLIYTHRWGDQYDSHLNAFTAHFVIESGDLRFAIQNAVLVGGTREVSEGLAQLGENAKTALQNILAYAGFLELAYQVHPFELIFETYWASGDDNPETDSSLTQATTAEDLNVGLHLFENVLAYETARSAKIGITNLKALGATSFPVDEIDTNGGLQNGVVLFPQAVVRPLDWFSARAGVMFAFTQTRSVDPIGSLLRRDGDTIEDDLVNFTGGPPGNYWGTEFDLGVTFNVGYGFLFDLEAAYLIPGDALEDENGDAVNSFFGAGRLTYILEP